MNKKAAKKVTKVFAALSLCIAMAAALTCNLNLAPAQAAKKISLNTKSLEIERGGKYQLEIKGKDGATAVWASTNEKVAKVTQAGRVTAIAPGTATITARLGGRIDACKVTVVASGVIAKEYYGTWKDGYGWDVIFSSSDMVTPLRSMLAGEFSTAFDEEYKGYSYVRVAAYLRIGGTPYIHVQARKAERRLSAFLAIEKGVALDSIHVIVEKGANPVLVTDLKQVDYLLDQYLVRIK